ncbi:MAG: CPBP family intramembrane glutamic endopeptidase [Candidatus Acidiferrales bacterium]
MNPQNESPVPGQQSPPKMETIEDRIVSAFVGPQGIRAGWRWLIFLAILIGCATLLVVVCVAVGLLHLRAGQQAAQTLTASNAALQEAIFVISMFIAAAIMAKIEKRPMGQYGLPLRQAFGRFFWLGIVWGFVAVTATLVLIAALHGFSFGKVGLSGRVLAGYAALWGFAFLLTGFFEEFVFRGYSQFTLATGMGFWPAAVLLSVLFGIIHLGNTGEALSGALSVVAIALFFCFTLRRTGSLWFAVGLHAAWDYGETFIYGVPDSGMVARGHLLNSSFHGPRWLTGGTVGPEASVACFVIIGLLFLIFHLAFPVRMSNENSG